MSLGLQYSCSKDSGSTAPPTQKASQFALVIDRTAGVTGTPTADSVLVDSGRTVQYSFQAATGYAPVTVILDGQPVSPAGTIVVNRRRGLAVGTTQVPAGSTRDTSAANTTRSVVTSSDPVSATDQLLTALNTAAGNLTDSAAIATIERIQALAYDSTLSFNARSTADSTLAGKVFQSPLVASPAGHSALLASATTDAAVPLSLLFVNGVQVSPEEFAPAFYLFSNVLIGLGTDIAHDPNAPLDVQGIYVPSRGVFSGDNTKRCIAEAMRRWGSRTVDWVTVARDYGRCGDFGAAAVDISSLLNDTDPTIDATDLASTIRTRLQSGRSVILVGHSRGTAVAQKSIELLKSDGGISTLAGACIGLVSVAPPLWKPQASGAGLGWSTIAAGQRVADILIQGLPSLDHGASIETNLTRTIDANYPSFDGLQLAYKVLWGKRIHEFASYVASQPTRDNARKAIRDIATSLQAQCPLRNYKISLATADNISVTVGSRAGAATAFVVKDGASRPVTGALVTFGVVSGSLVNPANVATGSDGKVEFTVEAGSVSGPAVLSASVAGTQSTALLHVNVVEATLAPTITLSSSSKSFSATVGGSSPATQSVDITNGGTGSLSGLTATVSYTTGQPTGWLTATLGATSAPTTLTLAAAPGSLAVGTYDATVSIASTAAGVTNSPKLLPVTFTVSAAPTAPTISLSASTASFSAAVGGSNPVSQEVQVTNSGTGTLSGLSTTVTYQAGQSSGWLTATLDSTTAPAKLTIGAATGALAVGTYNGTVSIASTATGVTNSPQAVTVTFTVSAAPLAPTIALSSTSVAFAATSGSGNPEATSVAVTNGGSGTLSGLSVGTISYGAGQPTGWLQATLSATTAPSTLSVTATTGSLAAGSYSATVPIASTASGVTNSPVSIAVTFTVSAPDGFTADVISAGAVHSCAIKSDGKTHCWGDNSFKQLGDNSVAEFRALPGPVTQGTLSFVAIAGYHHSCALTASGAMYCWGGNSQGQIGDGTTTQQPTPVPGGGGIEFTSIAIAQSRTCGIAKTGVTYCWGINEYGQTGDSTTSRSLSPQTVKGGLSFEKITVGPWHTCALTSGGAAYCWGRNSVGQLGDGSTINFTAANDRSTPVPVVGGQSFKGIAAGTDFTCALTTAGKLYCWGGAGVGLTNHSSTPLAVSPDLTFDSLEAGTNYACALTATGAAYCWGYNQRGELGDGSTTNRTTPVAVTGGIAFSSLSAGAGHTCGISTSGVAYCWGYNLWGQVGDGTAINRSSPVRVSVP